MASNLGLLFQGMTEEALREIEGIGAEESCAQGDFLFQASDPAEHLYILLDGRVRVAVGRDGRVAHIFSRSGEAIGWSSMAGNEAYLGSAECLGPVRVIKLQTGELNRIFDRHPASGMAFFRRLANYIGGRLMESYGGMLSLQQKPGHRPYEYGG
jgi:CRP-like cAMP-binding protein